MADKKGNEKMVSPLEEQKKGPEPGPAVEAPPPFTPPDPLGIVPGKGSKKD